MPSALYKKGKCYWFHVPQKVFVDGKWIFKKKWISTGEQGYGRAVTAQGRHYEGRGNGDGSAEGGSWIELKTRFLDSLAARNKTKKSIDSYKYAISRLESAASMKKATDLNHANMDAHCKSFNGRVSEATLNKDINCLKAIGTYAVSAKFSTNPLLAGYPKFHVPDMVRDRFLTPEELQLFFSRIKSRTIKTLCCLGYYACMRMEEAVMCRKDYFIWNKNLLKIPPRKTKRIKAQPDFIPIHADLAKYIKSIMNKVPGDHICTYDDGTLITAHNGTNHVNEIFDSCGLPECTHTTLRHTFISQLIMAGVDSEIVKRWARKKDLTPYLHLSPKFNDTSINLLPSTEK